MTYTIQPICVGTINLDKASLTYMRGFGQRLDAPILIWVLRSADDVYVVDTGADASVFAPGSGGRRRQSERQRPETALAEAGVDPSDVRTVIMTHLHYDHAGNCDLFPRAELVVQRRELEYARDPLPVHRRVYDSPARALPDEAWSLVDGDVEVAPGLSVILTPGHTPGLQAVLVETGSGPVVLAADTVPLLENWNGEPPEIAHIPISAFLDIRDWYRSVARLEETNARVIPGHDPEILLEEWPQ